MEPQEPYTNEISLGDTNPESTRRHIDLEIQKLEKTIRHLKSRRNRLAPISRLPPEILSQIFIFCASGMATAENLLSWIKVTHVSGYWRTIAIDCPILWANIITSRPEWTKEMLRRSKGMSLVLNVHLSSKKELQAVQLVLQHIARIKILRILAPKRMIKKFITDQPLNAPLLQSLSLSISRNVDNHFTLPEGLFSGDIPRLQKLELNKCNLTWDSPVFNDLTILKICNVLREKRPTTHQLMDILEKMPALQFLYLKGALPLIANEAILTKPANRIIDLSHLSHITVDATVPECTNLLNHITFPRNVTYSFKTWGTETTGHDFSTILNAISNVKTCIRTLHIISELNLTIKGWLDSLDIGSMHRKKPQVELILRWKEPGDGIEESVITAVCKAFSLAHLENLYFSNARKITPKTWFTLFGGLPKLRLVHLREALADNFISALREKPTPNRKTQPASSQGKSSSHRYESVIPLVYFPNLQILTMKYLHFNFNDLRNCLIERNEQKAGLQELRLIFCNHLAENEVELLEEVVNLTLECSEAGDESEDSSDYDDYGSDYY